MDSSEITNKTVITDRTAVIRKKRTKSLHVTVSE